MTTIDPSMPAGAGEALPGIAPVAPSALIEARHISKDFESADGSMLHVLDDISLALYPGEVVALLGKSGSGKSTLLRCLAGLISPSVGEVYYRGQLLTGANPGVAMVFQSFALMPWLTVLDNVELGLRAQGVPPEERRIRAEAAIDQIGLDGFESAYPRELSGGMRQRVGFARALVLRPDVLMMDEPFSALDVLTTENLRKELATMWAEPDFAEKAVCIVTHNIEESVLLADRVIVLGSNPGRLRAEVDIPLPRPRDRKSPEFEGLVDFLYGQLTGRDAPEEFVDATDAPAPKQHAPATPVAEVIDVAVPAPINVLPTQPVAPVNPPVSTGMLAASTQPPASTVRYVSPPAARSARPAATSNPLATPLPDASVGGMAGLVEMVAASGGHVALDDLSARLNFEVDDLFPLVDAAEMLGLLKVHGVYADLTEDGENLATANILHAKELFAKLAEQRAPLVQTIVQALRSSVDGSLREDFFRDLLRRGFNAQETERQLDTAIDWGRYGELFDFDSRTQELRLTPPTTVTTYRR